MRIASVGRCEFVERLPEIGVAILWYGSGRLVRRWETKCSSSSDRTLEFNSASEDIDDHGRVAHVDVFGLAELHGDEDFSIFFVMRMLHDVARHMRATMRAG